MHLDLGKLEEPISRILNAPDTDLTTISAKRVRKMLLEDARYAYLGLTAEVLKTRRGDVDQVIARVYEEVNQAAGTKRKREKDDEAEEEERGGPEGEGEGDPTETYDDDNEEVLPPRSAKKKKGKKSVEESDAAFARKLSTEINSRSRRGASTGGGSASSPRKVAKRKPKKSAATIESEDEDVDGEAKPKKRGTAKGGFAKEYTLSDPLSAVLATEKMSRPQVVKKLWEYIRQHQLQNPSNKKEIICDDALRAVFAVDKIDMFRMNKVLGQHLHEG